MSQFHHQTDSSRIGSLLWRGVLCDIPLLAVKELLLMVRSFFYFLAHAHRKTYSN